MAADLKSDECEILKPINEITRVIIGTGMRVSSALGVGFAEKVYENLLVSQLRKGALQVEQQAPLRVEYDNEILGVYVADVVVEGVVIVEVKALPALQSAHRLQCINYLRATGLPICLLLNFGRRRLEFKRFANTHRPQTPAPLPASTG